MAEYLHFITLAIVDLSCALRFGNNRVFRWWRKPSIKAHSFGETAAKLWRKGKRCLCHSLCQSFIKERCLATWTITVHELGNRDLFHTRRQYSSSTSRYYTSDSRKRDFYLRFPTFSHIPTELSDNPSSSNLWKFFVWLSPTKFNQAP